MAQRNMWFLILVASGAAACNGGRTRPSAPEMSREVEFRLRAECAAQAEMVVTQTERESSATGTSKVTIVDSQSHYNMALNRCILLVTKLEGESQWTTEVFDAFEHSRLLACTGPYHRETASEKKRCIGEATYTTPTWLTLLTPPEVPVSEAESRITAYLKN